MGKDFICIREAEGACQFGHLRAGEIVDPQILFGRTVEAVIPDGYTFHRRRIIIRLEDDRIVGIRDIHDVELKIHPEV